MDRVKRMIRYPVGGSLDNGYGAGVVAAVLDTGLAPHPDLKGRILGFLDCVGHRQQLYDDSGHGTHVAGILAGDGRMSGGILSGMAPAVRIIALKVLDYRGEGRVEYILEGLEWICLNYRKYGIRVVNLSVGARNVLEYEKEKKLLEAVEMLWDEGVAVIVSAGNEGPGEGTVVVPGTSRKVITVGMLAEENAINCSGQGPTEHCVLKPDVVAPGRQVISCNAVSSRNRKPYTVKSGTSMATPVVAGAAAMYLSRYPGATNVELKLKLRETCMKVPGMDCQGWGCLNVSRLLE